MTVLIGTSGWQYKDWKPLLYADVPQRLWLERHAAVFQYLAKELVATYDDDEDVFAYTNNDPTGAALPDAEHLADALHSRGRTTSRLTAPAAVRPVR